MPYQVIARKWRPQTFEEIVGQSHVTTTLMNSLESGRIGHAFLFTGIRGVGKTTAARVLAKALNCEKGPGPTPCNECSSCTEIRAGTSLDVKEIDGASNRGIDSIRELREGVAFAPARDRFKVYIVDEVHMLTQEAFNALLKTLEEPPAHVVFIFATTELHKVPRTIASRCQVFEFNRISVADIVASLRKVSEAEGIDVDDDALRVVAREADGSLRDASSLLDQVISFAGDKIGVDEVTQVLRTGNREAFGRALGAVLTQDAAEAMRVLDDLVGRGLPPRQFLIELARYLADCMKVDLWGADAARETGLTQGEIDEMAGLVRDSGPEFLAVLLNLLVTSADQSADSRSPDLLAQAALVRAAGLKGLSSVESMITRLEAIQVNGAVQTEGPIHNAPAHAERPRQVERPIQRDPPSTPPPVAERPAPPKASSPPTRAIKRKPPPPAPQPSEAPPTVENTAAGDERPHETEATESPSRPDASSRVESQPEQAQAGTTQTDAQFLDMFRKLPAVDKVLGTFGGEVVRIRKEKQHT
ncbi:MAG: DNA polymerase III subunit gamma/tau [Deltaproteobacteria bacterium]|nr:DNA polymerase III subunit gamma/tau [Deltaproteobacteria bacterium]